MMSDYALDKIQERMEELDFLYRELMETNG